MKRRGIAHSSVFAFAFGVLSVASIGGTAAAATFQIVNIDSAGEGFNDNTPAVPVGGNDGTTVGQQRLIAFQYAAGFAVLPWTDNAFFLQDFHQLRRLQVPNPQAPLKQRRRDPLVLGSEVPRPLHDGVFAVDFDVGFATVLLHQSLL